MKLNLWDTCLVAVCHQNTPDYVERTCRVMRYTRKLINFGGVILFTHFPPPPWYEGNRVQLPAMDREQGNLLLASLTYALEPHDHTLYVSEDGFPLDTALWQPEFQNFDYIGAPWADGVVGNNGFCMYSSRFFAAYRTLPFNDPNAIRAQDEWFCRYKREVFEMMGIEFSPTDLAERFSTETTGRDKPSFGFHGRILQPEKYAQGWRLVEKSENQT